MMTPETSKRLKDAMATLETLVVRLELAASRARSDSSAEGPLRCCRGRNVYG